MLWSPNSNFVVFRTRRRHFTVHICTLPLLLRVERERVNVLIGWFVGIKGFQKGIICFHVSQRRLRVSSPYATLK